MKPKMLTLSKLFYPILLALWFLVSANWFYSRWIKGEDLHEPVYSILGVIVVTVSSYSKQFLSLFQPKNENSIIKKCPILREYTHIVIPDESTGYALLMLKMTKALDKPCLLDKPINKFKTLKSIEKIATANSIHLNDENKRQGDKVLNFKEVLRMKNFPWKEFWESTPLKCPPGNPDLAEENSVIIVPEKYKTDGNSRDSAENQSIGWDAFQGFYKFFSEKQLVLGQHFDKNKKEETEPLIEHSRLHKINIPGLDENKEFFGIRGIPLHEWKDMYEAADLIIGIAGTHTWQVLTMFPNKPQIIFFNNSNAQDGKFEDWTQITDHINNVVAIPFKNFTEGNQFEILANDVGDAVTKLLDINKPEPEET